MTASLAPEEHKSAHATPDTTDRKASDTEPRVVGPHLWFGWWWCVGEVGGGDGGRWSKVDFQAPQTARGAVRRRCDFLKGHL